MAIKKFRVGLEYMNEQNQENGAFEKKFEKIHDLDIDISHAKNFNFIPKYLEKKREENKSLSEFAHAQLSDLNARKWHRIILSAFFCILLISQNIYIFHLITKALEINLLTKLQAFLGILTTSTLAETYLVLQLIVKWVFKDVPYKPDHENKS
mgnify:CR=1 FL=1